MNTWKALSVIVLAPLTSPLRLRAPGKPLTPAPTPSVRGRVIVWGVRPVDTHIRCPVVVSPQHSVRLTPSQCTEQWYGSSSAAIWRWHYRSNRIMTPSSTDMFSCLRFCLRLDSGPVAQDSFRFRSRDLANLAWECFLHHLGMMGMSCQSDPYYQQPAARNR